MSTKIYDKDIDLWQATVETHTMQLRRCKPNYEKEFAEKRMAAIKVLGAIQEYKELCESYPDPLPSIAPFTSEPFA